MSTNKLAQIFEKFGEILEVEKSIGDDRRFQDLHKRDITVKTGVGYPSGKETTKDHSREADHKKGEDKKLYKKVQKGEEQVTADDVVNSSFRKKVQNIRHRMEVPSGDDSFYEEKKDDPCWDGYEMRGYKMKNGKKVPNCVKKED